MFILKYLENHSKLKVLFISGLQRNTTKLSYTTVYALLIHKEDDENENREKNMIGQRTSNAIYIPAFTKHYENVFILTECSDYLIIMLNINPPKLFFFVVFWDIAKDRLFCLPIHRRDAHRKFFWWSLLKLKLKFLWKGTPVSSWALKG